MSDYVITIAEALEILTGYDFDAIMTALDHGLRFDFSPRWPDPTNPADMRRLFRRLRPWLT